jgi:flagellar hook-basal body complex protein FliE
MKGVAIAGRTVNPEEFATKKYPLRSSKLPQLAACTLTTIVSMLNADDEEAGQPADTGSALHKAIEEWHKNGQDAEKAVTAMKRGMPKYPKADLADAADMFRAYVLDPRNINAEIVTAEEKIEINLNPSPIDPTKKEIVILGTLDQIRRMGGALYLWDVKSSQRPGDYQKRNYALQLAAYSLGGTILLGQQVNPGGIIRTRQYQRKRPPVDPRTEPDGVFIPVDFNYDDIDGMLDIIRQKVALVRMGHYSTTPHVDWCGYCRLGLNNCNSLLKAMKEAQTKKASNPNGEANRSSESGSERKPSYDFGTVKQLPSFTS